MSDAALQQRIDLCAAAVRELQHGDAGHDWLHIERVWRLAARIAHDEHADSYLVELAALTHDLDDSKFATANDVPYAKLREALARSSVPLHDVHSIRDIVSQISWSGGALIPSTLEARVVQDADRLDAIGAIGIARTFSFGGYKGRAFYERAPSSALAPFADSGPTTIAHFAEKLLLVKDRLHTQSAKALAQGRHEYLRNYVAQLAAEVDGKR